MKRCAFAFLKGKAVLSCLELCMAMAVLGQKDPSATAAALHRNALHDSTDQKSGLTVALFHPLSVKSKTQPINLSRLADIQAYVHPTNKKDHGNRRMQFACDTEKTALYSCFYDPTCEGCYDALISEALEQLSYCGVIESKLCAIHSKCYTCGCEYQADTYFQCLLDDALCEIDVNCPDTTCEEELISLSECEDQLNPTCLSCVLEDTVDTTGGCFYVQPTACESAATCACGICTDKVEAWYACLLPNDCEDIDFACPSDGGSGLSAMWALVAIPLIAVIAVIVYVLMRKKPDDHPVNVKTPINEFSETPPASPSRNRCDAHTPGSHPHQRDLSADEFYVNDRPNGSVAYSASHYSVGRSASESVRTHEDHHHDAFEEVGVRSGRINDPPRVSPVSPGSSNWNTASAAATSSIPNSGISSTSRNTGGYVVRIKDQCRTVCGELPTAMAIIVDDVVPMEPRCDQSKRSPDP